MKKFLIIGNMNACTYKELFPYLKEGKIRLGISLKGIKCSFICPDGTIAQVNNSVWFTNQDIRKPDGPKLTKIYVSEEYPKYDNYDAINCDRIKDIPYDYNEPIGVPITIFNYLGNDGLIHLGQDYSIVKYRKGDDGEDLSVNKRDKYSRVIIKKV